MSSQRRDFFMSNPVKNYFMMKAFSCLNIVLKTHIQMQLAGNRLEILLSMSALKKYTIQNVVYVFIIPTLLFRHPILSSLLLGKLLKPFFQATPPSPISYSRQKNGQKIMKNSRLYEVVVSLESSRYVTYTKPNLDQKFIK